MLDYSFSIRSGDGSDREFLGCIDLLNDYAALAFGNDVIRDMMRGNSDQYVGWAMDIAQDGRAVRSIAVIEKERYFSVQLIDLYTFNFAYLGSRTTGNGGGNFLIAGPDWKGQKPEGVKEVIRAETELLLAVYRTQLFNPDDLENVKKVQDGYKVQTRSAFLGTIAPTRRAIAQSW